MSPGGSRSSKAMLQLWCCWRSGRCSSGSRMFHYLRSVRPSPSDQIVKELFSYCDYQLHWVTPNGWPHLYGIWWSQKGLVIVARFLRCCIVYFKRSIKKGKFEYYWGHSAVFLTAFMNFSFIWKKWMRAIVSHGAVSGKCDGFGRRWMQSIITSPSGESGMNFISICVK